MPKRVDHEQRRRELTDAFGRVVANDGLGAASYRAVAAEAGVSVKRVQYYFETKAALLAEALRQVGDRVVARGMTLMSDLGPDPTPRELLKAAAAGTLPVDDESRLNLHLFYSFYIAAITDPELASVEALQSQEWTVSFVSDLIRQAQDLEQVAADVDADHEGLVLMMTIYGLCLSVLAGHVTPQRATASIDRQLDQLFL